MKSAARPLGALIAAVALVGAMTACTAPATEGEGGDGDGVRLAYFSFAADNTYSQATLAGIESVAAERGATVEAFDGAWDATVQAAAMEDALASGRFDGFIVSANDGNALVPVVEDAIAAGVKVAATFTPIGPDLDSLDAQVDGLTATIGPPLSANGKSFAQMIVDACADRDPCQAAFLPGMSTLPLDAIRIDAMQAELKNHPNVDLVAVIDGGYDSTSGYAATQDLLAAYPGVQVIGTAGDQSAAGVELALADMGRTDIAVLGNGASIPGAQAVSEGRWFATYVNLPFTEGKTAAELIFAALDGDDSYTAQNTEELSPIGPILTKENSSKFTAEWDG